jgi:GT2 family glycosyltransferase
MDESVEPTVDVVIPVYNAPESTKRCIDSVIAYLGCSMATIFIQDDASGAETSAMLDGLPYRQLHIHHAPENQGYGKSVNEAIARSAADLVLVLNSDTEVHENFLPILCRAFAADPKLAVISPATVYDKSVRFCFERYMRRPGGYITTYRFQGYAFLIRRHIFAAMGGFDVQFGRGYFEDTDLGRRLDRQGWRMGVHPNASIHHAGGASFGRGQSYRLLAQRNRALYLSRYPEARQNILLISGQYALTGLPAQLADAIEQVLRQGGGVHWLTPVPLPQLSCLQMRNSPASFSMIMKLMLRGWSREDKRISAVWILPDTSAWSRALLTLFIRVRKLEVRKW